MLDTAITTDQEPAFVNPRAKELSRRLLEVYPEAQLLLDKIAEHRGFDEVWISETPHIELILHQDQIANPGPFWTIIAQGSSHDIFRVVSISLDPENPSIVWRRRDGYVGEGYRMEGKNLVDRVVNDRFKNASLMYEFWFVVDKIVKS